MISSFKFPVISVEFFIALDNFKNMLFNVFHYMAVDIIYISSSLLIHI